MLANYVTDVTLFERCINLIDSIFPGIKNVAMMGIKYNARWDKVSLPFVIEENGEIIAHLGIIPLEMILNQKKLRIAAIHGICVKEMSRGKGLFKKLMQESLIYIENNFDASILFTDQPYLYKRYNFTVLPEYDFIVNVDSIIQMKSDLRILSLDNAHDLRIMQNLLSNHLPISNQMSLVNETTIFVLDNVHKKISYSEQFDMIIIYEIIENNLYIKDILSQKQYKMSEILALIPESFNNITLQFCPDKFGDLTYTPILADPECSLMVSSNFNFEGEFFRYPETYRC